MNEDLLGFKPTASRFAVIGTSCCGKTTFARALAGALRADYVELDALYWNENWTPRPRDEFIALTERAVAGPAWVVDGNYGEVRDLIWKRATAIAWLDYSFPLVFSRAMRRTVSRIRSSERMYSNNRETFAHAFLNFGGIPWWVIRTFRRRRRSYRDLLQRPEYRHLQVQAFRKPAEAELFLHSPKT
jgi:adenylate kinase family enzyme